MTASRRSQPFTREQERGQVLESIRRYEEGVVWDAAAKLRSAERQEEATRKVMAQMDAAHAHAAARGRAERASSSTRAEEKRIGRQPAQDTTLLVNLRPPPNRHPPRSALSRVRL